MKIRRVESMEISRARLKELQWFVRQYLEKKRRADTDEGARRGVERIEEAAEQLAGDLGKYEVARRWSYDIIKENMEIYNTEYHNLFS